MALHLMNGKRMANTGRLSSDEWEMRGKLRLPFQKHRGIPIRMPDGYPPHFAIGLTLPEDESRGLRHCPHHLLCRRSDLRG